MSQQLLDVIVNSISAKKGEKIVTLDVRGRSDVADFQIVCSGNNERQCAAICDYIETMVKKELKIKPAAIEGKAGGRWILIDYGSVLVHIFLNDLRDYYAIEQLWSA